jgi:hypothetical protein
LADVAGVCPGLGHIFSGCVKGCAMKLLSCLLFLVASTVSAAQVEKRIVGDAVDLESGEPLYSEEHLFYAGDRHDVIYRNVSSNVFAEKKLTYGSDPATPSFSMVNEWSGENISVQWAEDGLTGQYTSAVKSIQRGPDRISASSKRPLVIDAGFDAFVQQNWSKLLSGKTVDFDYVVPTRLRTAPLMMRYKGVDNEGLYQFEIKAKLKVLNLFLDPLSLRYNPQRELVEFRGQSNIADKTGRYLTVRIRYRTLE